MKGLKKFLLLLVIAFVGLNLIAAFHAYSLTHFTTKPVARTGSARELSIVEKIKTVVFGVDLPRPENRMLPSRGFETIRLGSDLEIECWKMNAPESKGAVLLFHGYGAEKSSMLDKAEVFLQLGYSVLLVDFMGSGGSKGTQTTIGYYEADQVKTCYDYAVESGESHISLMGTSMGAAAILRALEVHELSPASVILECPFGSMYETVCARFTMMNMPSFPMASLLVFWGGAVNGFWAFHHNPAEYAKSVKCPVMLMYGAKDDRVSSTETHQIFSNLGGRKELRIYPEAGHVNYLNQYSHEWTEDVKKFLATTR